MTAVVCEGGWLDEHEELREWREHDGRGLGDLLVGGLRLNATMIPST